MMKTTKQTRSQDPRKLLTSIAEKLSILDICRDPGCTPGTGDERHIKSNVKLMDSLPLV